MFSMALMLLSEKWVGAAMAVAGVVLAFAVPMGLKGVGETPAMALLASHMRQTGFTLLIIGLIKYGFDLYRWFVELPERAKAKATVGNQYKAEPGAGAHRRKSEYDVAVLETAVLPRSDSQSVSSVSGAHALLEIWARLLLR